MKQVTNFRRVFAGNIQFLTHLLMMQFGQRLGSFDAQAVQVKIFCVLSTFEQALRFYGRLRSNRDERQADHVHFSG